MFERFMFGEIHLTRWTASGRHDSGEILRWRDYCITSRYSAARRRDYGEHHPLEIFR